jgi:hypothetical protein
VRHTLTGSAGQMLAGMIAYRDLGVGDLSMVLGHDDASGMRTLDVMLGDVLPALAAAGQTGSAAAAGNGSLIGQKPGAFII